MTGRDGTKASEMIDIQAPGVRVRLNPQGGHLDAVEFGWGGRRLTPMHVAPWRTGEDNGGRPEEFGAEVPQTLRSLSGDFFCAPFAGDDLHQGPEHGPTANGSWAETSRERSPDGGEAVEFLLGARILGAEVRKRVTLRAGHPVVYQTHRFVGGDGAIPVAHHPMVRTGGGARLSFSPKCFGATPEAAIETDPARGRSALAYPQEFRDLAAVRLADGGVVDLRSQPGTARSEDFVLLAERLGSRFGWSAVLCPTRGYLFFAIRDPAVLPVTLLWLSNGGRDYPPFSGRHKEVLGIEEACTFFNAGHAASTRPNALTRRGIPTALVLDPDGAREVRFAFGAIAAPPGWSEVADILQSEGALRIRDASGAEVVVPFDAELAGLGEAAGGSARGIAPARANGARKS